MNNSNINLTPDSIVFFQIGFFKISATLVYTWIVMAVILLIAGLVSLQLKKGMRISKIQALAEAIVDLIQRQISEVMHSDASPYLAFLGSLFLFISISNLLDVIPLFSSPASSLYTTGALAIIVFFAVPVYGMKSRGLKDYFKAYIRPNPVMLPFNIISEFSRTLSLAVRLFGNVMSGRLLVAILFSVAPLFLPLIMQILGLLIGQIQAYIFVVLAAVYIASAIKSESDSMNGSETMKGENL